MSAEVIKHIKLNTAPTNHEWSLWRDGKEWAAVTAYRKRFGKIPLEAAEQAFRGKRCAA